MTVGKMDAPVHELLSFWVERLDGSQFLLRDRESLLNQLGRFRFHQRIDAAGAPRQRGQMPVGGDLESVHGVHAARTRFGGLNLDYATIHV
jgi:hypothetical protein